MFFVGRELQDHVLLTDEPGEDDEGLDGGREVGPETETCKSVVDKHLCFRGDGGHCDKHANRKASKTLCKEHHNSWIQGLVEGREDLQKQGRSMEGEVLENGGARPYCVLLGKRKLVWESSHLRQN